jgi:hypothetical protein
MFFTKRLLFNRVDTYRLVTRLEKNSFTRGQSVALTRTINALLADNTLKIRNNTLSKAELENESFKFKANLQQLRSELNLLRQNETAALRSETESILRQIERNYEVINTQHQPALLSLQRILDTEINSNKLDDQEDKESIKSTNPSNSVGSASITSSSISKSKEKKRSGLFGFFG